MLDVTQPALSKTLARLRRYFDDPLFVRVSLRMEPTPKALALARRRLRAILDAHAPLRARTSAIRSATSTRTFNFCVVDAGVIKLLPPLVKPLLREAPHVRLSVAQFDGEHLESWLESGTLDFAMGSFPALAKGIRRQPLWTESYVSVVRRGHPRLSAEPSLREFAAEKHVLVSTFGTGHAHGSRSVPSKRNSGGQYRLPHSDLHRRGGGRQADRRGRDAAAVGCERSGGRPRPADDHAADQAAQNRDLPILARAVSYRPGQSMDQYGLQNAVPQGGLIPASVRNAPISRSL